MAAAKRIYVYENWMGTEPSLMGCLYTETLRGIHAVWMQNPLHYLP